MYFDGGYSTIITGGGVGHNNPLQFWVGAGSTTPRMSVTTTGVDVAGTINASGGCNTSDIRFKKNLQPINQSLGKLMSLEGVSFEWKTDEYKDKGFREGRHYGVIAQKVEKVLPEVVSTGSDGTKAVAYTELIPVLIEAIKEQQKMINEQLTTVAGQKKEIDELKKTLATMQKQ
jgi:hypothetical protein